MDGHVTNPYSVLDRARELGLAYLRDVAARHVGGTATPTSLRAALGGPLPEGPDDPVHVIEGLAEHANPGIVATVGPRYFGFVTGGAIPVTVAADWLASVWDQNGALYVMSPAAAVMEDIVSAWLLELLHLPRASSVGFVTGCHMANFTCLAAARHEVLAARRLERRDTGPAAGAARHGDRRRRGAHLGDGRAAPAGLRR